MDENKFKKEGVSVREIESFARKNRLAVFFVLAFILATFFSFVMWGLGWSVVAAGVGAIIGVLLKGQISHLSKVIFQFVFKQEGTVQIIIAVVLLIIAIVIPPFYFLILGLHGGKDLQHWALEIASQTHR